MKENGPNSGKRPPAGADNVTIDRNSEEAVFIGERTQKVVKLRRSLRSPEKRCPSGETAVHWRQNPHNNSQKQGLPRCGNPLFCACLPLSLQPLLVQILRLVAFAKDIQHFRFAFLLRSGLLGAVNVAGPIPLIARR